MQPAALKLLFLLSCANHLLLWHCDRIITCLDGGRFGFSALKRNETLRAVIGATPLDRPLRSIILGVFAMTAAFPGYLALAAWMLPQSRLCAALMAAGACLFILPGIAHHVFCGAVEWFYIRMGRTESARAAIVEFFKKTSVTMYVCYLGLLLFAVSFLTAVLTGMTALPRWACLLNTLPLFLLLAPFHITGTGNLANAVMFAGLFFLI